MSSIKLGIDNIDKYIDDLFKNKRIGLITNQTGVDSNLNSTIDLFNEKTNLVALYSPEHGIRGDIQAGEKVNNYIDEKTELNVYSLYGKNKRPSHEVLKNIDILVFDIQDVGSRFYTYLYTMAYAMESCKKFNKVFTVLDRPNPIGGEEVEGNILDVNYKSFIGLYPITQRYGLTIGELAILFNEEFRIGCNLKVIKMEGWSRHMYFQDTKLPWIMPSPNMPTIDTALVYNGTCVFEGTNISEGRGTTKPFQIIGAPWLNPYKIAEEMNEIMLPGVKFRPIYFTPTFSKYTDVLCRGVEIHVTDIKKFKPVITGISLLYKIKEVSKDKFEFTPPYIKNGKQMIDYNTGGSYIRENKITLEEINLMWKEDAMKFKKIKEKYHVY
ncbi:uncharacterized protein YbbC (DUF1343 family) [Clostridium tetanomorphum]|uniref:DUF1343 domain-containing protein n=1 Tax=Clostridium tetanomorphum TaxID=1553 RepID=A0A923EBU6_CLOTT|nr:DUF1343 domain-containing protein [Clostridium tetanomorphum]KAJ49313.1 hypothetical protein CTM_23914 [Clostridium tetanomorphum DSM 665]KAJ53076.1 hypothetical protein CTM_04475 [Clostridium tetanomorphum DSM 665]MBC2398386.1 DUF1343 domain-containing protein [Clostridium tetanomorphum]MBP1865539.1 uncharacterized protein YbbC (DUF1343 family) [Clostridium tetanomorphum]NRS86485.1 uncharacterized protein YbbC (DUF1343 family) [Clostridium tetanomorphum]